jgi:hypothetical protein
MASEAVAINADAERYFAIFMGHRIGSKLSNPDSPIWLILINPRAS